jgi:hypothetical protein
VRECRLVSFGGDRRSLWKSDAPNHAPVNSAHGRACDALAGPESESNEGLLGSGRRVATVHEGEFDRRRMARDGPE